MNVFMLFDGRMSKPQMVYFYHIRKLDSLKKTCVESL